MAFTSETALKFGSDNIEFAVVTLLRYQLENEKSGAFNYRRKESITVSGYFSNRESSTPIEEHFRQVQLLLEHSDDFLELKINDKPYGKARFLNYSFPTSNGFDENSVRFTKFTIAMEVFKDDSSGTYADANLPSAASAVTDDWYKLKSFQENFSFNLQEDGNFLVSHSVSFGVDNIDKLTSSGVVSFANSIANQFFAQGLDSLSSIRSLYSSTTFQYSNKDYGSSLVSQETDLINYTFSYSKNYTVFSDNSSATSETLTTDLAFDAQGLIQVVERGRVKGKGNSIEAARQNAIAKLNSNLTSAYTRCNNYFNKYFKTSNLYPLFENVLPKIDSGEVLQPNAVSINKDLSGIVGEIGYEITFTTDPAYRNDTTPTKIHTFTISLTKQENGVVDSTIQGEVKYYTNKNLSFNNVADFKSDIIKTESSDSLMVQPYYRHLIDKDDAIYSGTKTQQNIQYTKFGAFINYSKNLSNSPIYNTGTSLIKSLSISESDDLPTNKFSTSNIANAKEVIYQTRQFKEGSRSVSLQMQINREVLYAGLTSANQDYSTVFSKIKDLLTTTMLHKTTGYLMGSQSSASQGNLLKIFGKIYNREDKYLQKDLTYYLNDLSLSIDGSYALSASSSFVYLLKKEKGN